MLLTLARHRANHASTPPTLATHQCKQAIHVTHVSMLPASPTLAPIARYFSNYNAQLVRRKQQHSSWKMQSINDKVL